MGENINFFFLFFGFHLTKDQVRKSPKQINTPKKTEKKNPILKRRLHQFLFYDANLWRHQTKMNKKKIKLNKMPRKEMKIHSTKTKLGLNLHTFEWLIFNLPKKKKIKKINWIFTTLRRRRNLDEKTGDEAGLKGGQPGGGCRQSGAAPCLKVHALEAFYTHSETQTNTEILLMLLVCEL